MLQTVETSEPIGTEGGSSVLHALSVVARRLGLDTTAEQLQRSYIFAGTEPPTEQVIAIAHEMGLEARPLTVKWADLPRLKSTFPAILRLKDGSALVLERIRQDPETGQVVLLRDPMTTADAIAMVDPAHLESVWAGEIILVKRRFDLADERQPFGFKWLLGQVMRERRLFTDIGAAALVSTVFALAPPFIFMIVMDRVLVNHPIATLNVLVGAILDHAGVRDDPGLFAPHI